MKYLTKDGNKIINIMSLLNAAFIEIARRPSIADDSATPSRISTHLLQRFLNKMTGHVEIAGQLATAALLRLPAAIYSHEFWYVHIRPALSSVLKVHANESLRIVKYSSTQAEQASSTLLDQQFSNTEDLMDEDLQVGFNPIHFGLDDEDEESSRDIVRTAEGFVVTTTQEEHYKYRSSALEFMSLYVYSGVVVVVPKGNQSRLPTEEATTHPAGRKANATFDFDSRHSLFETHTQRLRSKQTIPILAGAPPPRHPGSRRTDASWVQAADRFAAYVLTLHMPWDLDLGAPKFNLTYETLQRWAYDLSVSRNFLSLATLFWIQILAQGMSVSATTLSTTSQYRSRFAKRWGMEDKVSFDIEEGNEQIDDMKDKSLAASVLNEMIAVFANMAPSSEKTAAKLNAERIVHDLAIMDLGLTVPKAIPPELPGRRDISSNVEIDNIYSSWARHEPDAVDSDTLSSAANQVVASSNRGEPVNSASISRSPVPHFMQAQNTALLRCINWFIQDSAHIADPQCPPPSALYLHISGAAGTGKTTFVKELDIRLGGAASGSVMCVAPTGIAATGLPRGMTIHAAFAIAAREVQEVASASKGAAISARDRFKRARIVVIDEISMVNASLLISIDVRLRDWFNSSQPFAGLAVVIMGDFFQLPAIQGSLLNVTPTSQAGLLFGLFKRLDFDEQCRAAGDVQHAARLEYFRNPSLSQKPIEAAKILDHLKCLSKEDFEQDASWYDAPVVVAENLSRHSINKAQVIRDAKRTGQPVLTWKNSIDPKAQSLFNRASRIHNVPVEQLLEKYPETSSFFIVGARVMLLDNILTEKRISNGTTCVLHSITFDPALGRAAINEEFARIASSEPGTIVELKHVPYSVNVRLNEDIQYWDPAETLDPTQVVIPLRMSKKRPREFRSLGRQAASLASKSTRKLAYYDFGFELAYAVTYHKVQGQTLSKVILDLNGSNSSTLSLPAFYVGLSRVRLGNNIRILPISAEIRKKLLNLRFGSVLKHWWTGGSG